MQTGIIKTICDLSENPMTGASDRTHVEVTLFLNRLTQAEYDVLMRDVGRDSYGLMKLGPAIKHMFE